MYISGRKIYLIVYVIESIVKINFIFSIWTIINKIQNIKFGVCVMFKIKYGLNIMHSTILSRQGGWFDGKGIDICL
jgi:hypothetical protein